MDYETSKFLFQSGDSGCELYVKSSEQVLMTRGSHEMSSRGYDDSSDTFKVIKRTCTGRVLLVAVAVIALVLGLIIGLLLGAFAVDHDDDDAKRAQSFYQSLLQEANPGIADRIISGIDAGNIRENLRVLTEQPHIAGRRRDFELVDMLRTRFQESGLHVQVTPYDVLLSYPNDDTPNSLRLLDNTSTVMYDAARDESNFSKVKDVVPQFHAYSPKGLVEGEVVYAGFGRVDDYEWLLKEGINVSGYLVIVKYGRLFRGDKVDIATRYGAAGVIMFLDPADVTGYNMGDPRVYPDTWWLPPSGSQRGTVFTGSGDPLTPGFAANDLAYRYTEETVVPPMPQIPSIPVGYGAAENIMRELTGDKEVPLDWQGGLNLTYKTGPGFLQPGWKVQLNVTSSNQRAKAENVFGIIRGSVEPDRYVLYGNHRDAWIYGAVDPSSGTAVMLELARVMGDLVQKGVWKPRRSIILCSWGAEEYGLLGSTEWVEQYVATLRERAVAYVNVDIAVRGNDTLSAGSTPMMHDILFDAAKKVPNPNPDEIAAGRKTVYDTWLKTLPWPNMDGGSAGIPGVGNLGSGSDYAPLLQRAGITAVDISYVHDPKKYNVTGYPIYHTEYETFQIVDTQIDRGFEVHAAMARVAGEMIRNLADSLVLPFHLSSYSRGLEVNRKALDKDYGTQLRNKLSNYDLLEKVIANFSKDVDDFETRLKSLDKSHPFALRVVNDQMLLLEKAFLVPDGLPTRPLKKHLIFAENANDAYAGSSFPGLVDLLFQIGDNAERWELVRQHFSTVLQTIQSAGATLRDVTSFMLETLI
ncbi:putative N-acetylated-alpha-linked acidic dipeptidase [Aplysia californica]|uniref:N-acetylated-alpha-linked acidic dipeptidase n=1 Tax=Aplysia californica TaxID=6500 RepID=A0ABM1AEL1_APLCA|nr:putative N-acetylated-alpha-linked acidic dipeptidase [Aplysia californica]